MYPHISQLHLSVKLGFGDKTIIDKMFFTPPFKIIEPFYDESTAAHIILMVASAGLMAGDRQEMCLDLQEKSRLHLTSQSFEKVHDTQDDYASRQLFINVANHAMLDFNPLPCILFENASFRAQSDIQLKADSILYHSEILAARNLQNAHFAFKSYITTLKIFIENKLVLFDNTRFIPSQMPLENLCFLGDFSHYLNLIIIDKAFNLHKALEYLESQSSMCAITAINGGYCLKALGYGSEELLKLRADIINIAR
ncbi:urease accessory protein UreD [Helicobacter jaachi]|uniref:Urease accessory protein UreD n=1 Tax=Helicobacter jaachi TaxID=1677920 RepID=A0A4U8T7U5_9HELI|nr:urease accessory protein UreD [Helicobacter jaachi]TLD95740.1 urease accessory protein UreD [Helicobacter jaachi]